MCDSERICRCSCASIEQDSLCMMLLLACSSEDDVDFDKTIIVTGKVIQQNEERKEKRAKHYLEVLTIIKQTKKNLT